ncbi:hypothetical protein DFH27DRAFT_560279 [Peziza echinospora]|nr:hypothetical protein DFH27DRAFT_560279 [Peziza echinospora]
MSSPSPSDAGSEPATATPESYALLAQLELDFDAAEVEVLRQQTRLFRPLYARRKEVLKSIPGFWPLIFENFGTELDEHIGPCDWACLGDALVSLEVLREDEAEPRSFEVVFGFRKGNGVIKGPMVEEEGEGQVQIRKTFTFKSLRDGDESWAGLVSEPAVIEWESDAEDLTGGVNALAKKIFELRRLRVERKIQRIKAGVKREKGAAADADGVDRLELELAERLRQSPSFFNWFSWTGEYFMVMEKEAERNDAEFRERKEALSESEQAEEDDAVDVFQHGEKMAYLIAEDAYPNALKHFADAMEAQEAGAFDGEDNSGEDDDEDMEGSIDLESEEEEIKHVASAFKRSGVSGGKKRRSGEGEDEEKAGAKKSRK